MPPKKVQVILEPNQGLPKIDKLEFPETATMLNVMRTYVGALRTEDQQSPVHYALVPGGRDMGKEMFTPPLNQQLRNLLAYYEKREITISVSKTPSMG